MAKMINNVCGYYPRTQRVAELAVQVLADEPERRLLILSDRRQHLEDLRSTLVGMDVDADAIGMVVGGIKKDVLKANEERCSILLGTYAYVSEGFDVQTLNTLILASPKSDVIQVCGRILRCPSGQRTVTPLILDVVDKFSVFENQARKRAAYYRSQGFAVEKIAANQ
jgi:superfamily II DNA or RNA helicase